MIARTFQYTQMIVSINNNNFTNELKSCMHFEKNIEQEMEQKLMTKGK